ncbi:MAG: SocA family protein [Prevotella sp.]|nr:SocA family protein [Prevotella sp.]
MEDVVKIASYISQRYEHQYGTRIDEMKLHKLLYFTQRECLVQLGEPMFGAKFKAWKYGPVILEIRQHYKDNSLSFSLSRESLQKYQGVFDKVFEQYAPKQSWSLSTLTYDTCDVDIDLSDIRKDAERINIRRFLLARYKDFQMSRA